MDRRLVTPRRLIATASLLAVSVALHALVVSGLAGWLGSGVDDRPAPVRSAPVEVALVAPPAAPLQAAPGGAGAAPAVAPRPARRAAPAPAGVARTPGSAPTVRAVGPDPTHADPGESDRAGLAPAGTQPGADPADAGEGVAADARADVREPAAAGDAPAAAAPAAAAADERDAARPPGAAHPPLPSLPSLPESQRQRFRVYWGDYTEARSVARLEYRLVRDGERYEIRTAAEAEGLISLVYSGTLSQVSVGRLGPAGLEPLHYAEQRGKRPERSVAFDPQSHRLTPGGDRAASVWLPPGTQDRLSVFYQIGLLARADPGRFVAGAVQTLPVATMREVRIERFEVVGDETLPTPGGPIRALHLHRPPPPGTDDPRIDVWLGYDFQMLPVRLRVEDAGRRVLDQVIDRGG